MDEKVLVRRVIKAALAQDPRELAYRFEKLAAYWRVHRPVDRVLNRDYVRTLVGS